ncbi:MAG: winged helix-turn-helix transcriptional regulator [Chloroflexota bacterium]
MRTRARKRILDYVTNHPYASASRIARGLGMSSPAVRHHLGILRSDGRIELGRAAPGRGRGRPQLFYRISERLVGDNLAMIADRLLQTGKASSTSRAAQKLMDAVAQGLSDQLGPFEGDASPASRIAALVKRLNLLHYRAHWEAGAEGPRLMFGHCPYAAVIERHPELCQMDGRAVSEAMGTRARQIAKIDLSGRTGSQCIFSFR